MPINEEQLAKLPPLPGEGLPPSISPFHTGTQGLSLDSLPELPGSETFTTEELKERSKWKMEEPSSYLSFAGKKYLDMFLKHGREGIRYIGDVLHFLGGLYGSVEKPVAKGVEAITGIPQETWVSNLLHKAGEKVLDYGDRLELEASKHKEKNIFGDIGSWEENLADILIGIGPQIARIIVTPGSLITYSMAKNYGEAYHRNPKDTLEQAKALSMGAMEGLALHGIFKAASYMPNELTKRVAAAAGMLGLDAATGSPTQKSVMEDLIFGLAFPSMKREQKQLASRTKEALKKEKQPTIDAVDELGKEYAKSLSKAKGNITKEREEILRLYSRNKEVGRDLFNYYGNRVAKLLDPDNLEYLGYKVEGKKVKLKFKDKVSQKEFVTDDSGVADVVRSLSDTRSEGWWLSSGEFAKHSGIPLSDFAAARWVGLEATREMLEKHNEGKLKGRNLGITMLDVKKLKKVNDTFGHAEGDRYLKAVYEALEKAMEKRKIKLIKNRKDYVDVLEGKVKEPSAFVYRSGGDEVNVVTIGVQNRALRAKMRMIEKEVNKELIEKGYDSIRNEKGKEIAELGIRAAPYPIKKGSSFDDIMENVGLRLADKKAEEVEGKRPKKKVEFFKLKPEEKKMFSKEFGLLKPELFNKYTSKIVSGVNVPVDKIKEITMKEVILKDGKKIPIKPENRIHEVIRETVGVFPEEVEVTLALAPRGSVVFRAYDKNTDKEYMGIKLSDIAKNMNMPKEVIKKARDVDKLAMKLLGGVEKIPKRVERVAKLKLRAIEERKKGVKELAEEIKEEKEEKEKAKTPYKGIKIGKNRVRRLLNAAKTFKLASGSIEKGNLKVDKLNKLVEEYTGGMKDNFRDLDPVEYQGLMDVMLEKYGKDKLISKQGKIPISLEVYRTIRSLKQIPTSEFKTRIKTLADAFTTGYMMGKKLGRGFMDTFYHPVKEASDLATKERSRILREFYKMKKKLNLNADNMENIGIYAISRIKQGRITLEHMGIDPKGLKLTLNEEIMYKWLRKEYNKLFKRLNFARQVIGKKPLKRVRNYVTFFRILSEFTKEGRDIVTENQKAVEAKFHELNDKMIKELEQRVKVRVSTKKAPLKKVYVVHERRRVRSLLPLELNVEKIFKSYVRNVLDYSYVGTTVARLRAYIGTMSLKDGKEFYNLSADKPGTYEAISKWLNIVAWRGNVPMQEPYKKFEGIVNKLRRNLLFSVLSFSLRTTIIQPSALALAIHKLGFKEVNLAFVETFFPGRAARKAEAIDKSHVLANRMFDALALDFLSNFRSYKKGSKVISIAHSLDAMQETAGMLGLRAISFLDMWSATLTWRAAYRKALGEGKSEKEAAKFADEVVIETQGSGAPEDISPVQSTSIGKALTIFQTFNISNWNYLVNEVLGVGKRDMASKETAKQVFRYVAFTTIFNLFYEVLLGMHGPYPSIPFRFFEEKAKGESGFVSFMKLLTELVEPIPIIGGSLKYSSNPGGLMLQLISEVFQKPGYMPVLRSWDDLI
ncbi:MAG: hypothetical protein DRP09_14870, partial [Candidatus Thorarchaeota archaeon]